MRVLAVADEPGVLGLFERACREAGMTCIGVSSAGEAVSSLREWGPGDFTIALLDMALLVVSGRECWKLLRQIDPDLIGVFLINPEGSEREHALALGAEDYILRPPSLEDLSARLKAIRDRYGKPHAVRVGRLRFDLAPDSTYVDGKRINLTHYESRILFELALAHGAPVSKAELIERIWHTRSEGRSNLLQVHIADLRRKLRAAGADVIRTVWGKGYLIPVVDQGNHPGEQKKPTGERPRRPPLLP